MRNPYLDTTTSQQKVFSPLVLALLLIFTCVNSSPAATVRIGLSSDGELAQIAFERGFFKKAGLEVAFRAYPSGKRAMEGLFAGEVDLATTGETPVALNSFERSDFSVVAAIGSIADEFKVLTRKDRGLLSPGDLKGKRLTVQQASAAHFFLSLFLLKNGLSEKEVKITFSPIEEQPQALAEGAVDAVATREPFIDQARKLLGQDLNLLEAPGLYRKLKCLVAANSFIAHNSAQLGKVLSALAAAEDFVKKNQAESARIIAERMGFPYQELLTNWPQRSLRLALDQQLLLTLEDEARWAIKNQLTAKDRIPNYLKFIHVDGLQAIKPEAVTIIW